jgi:hypothetical protein
MPRGQNKPVPVEPPRFGGIVLEAFTEKHGADFRTTKRQTEVAGGTSVDGIHRQAASFIGGTFKSINRKNHKQC